MGCVMYMMDRWDGHGHGYGHRHGQRGIASAGRAGEERERDRRTDRASNRFQNHHHPRRRRLDHGNASGRRVLKKDRARDREGPARPAEGRQGQRGFLGGADSSRGGESIDIRRQMQDQRLW